MATGSSYPGSLDSWVDKISGDFLTVADVNARTAGIEQVELRLNQLLGGKSGGQGIIGGTGAGQNLNLGSTSHGSKGNIVFGTASIFNEVFNRLGLGTLTPSRQLHIVNQSGGATMLLQTDVDATPPTIELVHTTGGALGNIIFLGVDSGSTTRQAAMINSSWLDATASSMDSEIYFSIQNNANNTGFNMTAKLSSLGVWTNGSLAAHKEYEGDLQGSVIGKLKELKTLGVYHGKGVPAEKIETAERHYSPTAEDFFEVFGLGTKNSGGIAAADAAWIAARGLLELEARVAQLERR